LPRKEIKDMDKLLILLALFTLAAASVTLNLILVLWLIELLAR
jgi:hypothetical protein